MSGPKVVRIVSREEVEAICQRHLAAVRTAIEEVRNQAKKLGLFDSALEDSLLARNRHLMALFDAAKWAELQKRGPETVVYLQAEASRLREKAIVAEAAARDRRRQLISAARSVSAALDAAGVDVPQSLRQAASRGLGSGAETASTLEREIAGAVRRLPRTPGTGASADMQALAQRLGKGQVPRTVAEWMEDRTAAPSATEQRLDRLLAEVSALQDGESSRFEARSAEVAFEQDPSRRSLLTDSLVLDVSAHVAQLRAEESLRYRLRQAMATLESSATGQARALHARLKAALNRPVAALADALETEAAGLVEAEAQKMAAAGRRRAILSGLSDLGYQVSEGMETAWIRDGRVVVRRPGSEDYGVELGAPANASRMQVRLVGSDRPNIVRNAQRDADQEAIWCTDFDQLRADLAADGGEIVVERAFEPGTVPVKTVAMTLPTAAVEGAAATKVRSRSARP